MATRKKAVLVALIALFLVAAFLNVPLVGVPALLLLGAWAGNAVEARVRRRRSASSPAAESSFVLPPTMFEPEWVAARRSAELALVDELEQLTGRYEAKRRPGGMEARQAFQDALNGASPQVRKVFWAMRDRTGRELTLGVPDDQVLHLERRFKVNTHCRKGHLGPFYLEPFGEDRVLRTCPVDGTQWTEEK